MVLWTVALIGGAFIFVVFMIQYQLVWRKKRVDSEYDFERVLTDQPPGFIIISFSYDELLIFLDSLSMFQAPQDSGLPLE